MTEPTATPPAPPGEHPGEPPAERLDRVEHTLDRLVSVVEHIIPGSHAEAEERTEERLDRPSTVEEQVRAELAKAKADEEAAAAADAEKGERESLAAQLKKLEEKPPAAPLRKVEHLMGWHPR